MNKEQIKAKISAGIAGQGSAIDAGSVLPAILEGILDLIPETPAPTPVEPLEVTDITALTNEQLDALKCGDAVIKVTGKQKHLYLVTYKEEDGGGICLSYNAAGYGETVSYDRVEGGWQFNSVDVKTYGD